jgi:predicted nuclease of predicted toxin-antitoxin system
MKLLLMLNILWRLTAKLKNHFNNCFHVDYIGLTVQAKDTEMWNHALANDLIIVSDEDDFLNLANSKAFHQK